MPLFMDVHHMDGGVAVGDVAKAHMADLQEQAQYGVNYLKYWVNEAEGKIFCLVDAPDAESANTGTARRTAWSPTRSTRSAKAPDQDGARSPRRAP